MPLQLVLLPLFLEVALTFGLLFGTGFARVRAIRSGASKPSQVALGEPNWPPQTIQLANCYNNQFQLPVLFYIAVLLALMFHKADLLFVLLSYVFVVLRCLHAWEHVGANRLLSRFRFFVAGALVLMAMWVVLAFHLLLGL